MSVIPISYYRTHKENENISDCQDYFQINTEKNCFAIADGASQSFYPSIWAELLVKHFCQDPNINQNNWNDWLQPIQEKWFQEVEQRVIKAKDENRPIWVTSQNRFNFREPATSTFIGLQLIENQVTGSIVGDSCLFIVEDDQLSKKYQLIQTYLLKTSRDFNDSPGYFASYNKDNNFTPHDFKISLNQKKSPNNLYFILATDALSEYIFKCTENDGNNIFETLLSISSPEMFEDFVASARNSDNIKMKNDDVTLLILPIPNKSIDQSSLQSRDKIEENTKIFPVSSNEEYGKGNKSFSQFTYEVEGNTEVFPDSSNEEYGKRNKSSLQSRDEIERNTRVSQASSNKNSSKETENISDFIFHIFHLLKSNVKFHNLTQKSIPKVSLNRDKVVPTIEELQKQNTRLRYQRLGLGLGLGICFLGISALFGIVIGFATSTGDHRFATLKAGISIYNDQDFKNFIVNSPSNSHEVEIIKEDDKWIKFRKELYIGKNRITDNCNDCEGDEIETIIANPNKVINLRLAPDPKGVIFAQLKDKSRFKKLEFESENWYKFEFVGYIKK